MKLLPVIFKRQLNNYLCLPLTYFSIAVFVIANAVLGFHAGNFLEQNQTDLHAFFQYHPWLYLFLIPVISTQLWSDEHKADSLNFFYSLPVTALELTLGKFLAAWTICGLTLLLTFPLLITINYLGTANDSVILVQYLGSWLLSGAYLSASGFICVLTHQRLIILGSTCALLMTTSILFSMIDAMDHQTPIWIIDSLTELSPSIRFNTIDSGLLTLHDLLYFASLILVFLAATNVTLNYRKV
ncbi:ABC-2 transporter permease [Pseudomonas mucidolens]|uniref:ABC-2 type transport system permease protein n=1 Tax=Pseudomonas mucidolens TaxID=46679 RepID=A0A1H2N0V9_9PSED|nr:ABC transporter permease [Pseudomonas mucidolens]SDU99139.1 ABC-2 type transport system permease protein [Pseudomonas mucidolens]SQH32837.1 putative ABC transporter membrane protein [Pseudomonas mucidolens]